MTSFRTVREGNFRPVSEQLNQFQKSIKELIKDPSERRKVYISLMRKQATPVKNAMMAQIPVSQSRLKGSIGVRAIAPSYLIRRGATYQESLMPVIHVGPKRKRRKSKNEDGTIKEDSKFARYWAWQAYGTKNRYTKTGQFTGKIIANPYAEKAEQVVQSTINAMAAKIVKQMEAQYDKILTKRGLNKR